MSKKRFPPRRPLYAAGIRLQETRGASNRAWWAVRWQESLAAKDFLGRLGRARVYAMSGQVLGIEAGDPQMAATVMGGRTEPYRVTLRFRAPAGEARARLVARLRAEPMLLARLLANDLPMEVERLFREEGFDLFPGGKLGEGRYDVTTACTCPDYANPCKHALAVLTLLGEEAAWRPGRLLAWRGIPLEELCRED